MIAWVIFFGVLFILLTLPATIFGWICGKFAIAWLRGNRKPPLRPPI